VPETAFDWKLIHGLWQMLVESGQPVALDGLARSLHTSRERVQAVFERYPDAEYDQAGNLQGWGLSLNPTVHHLVVGGHSLYAWCAPDTLYSPVVLNRSAQIVSHCPVSRARIEISLTPVRLERGSPAGAVVSVVRERAAFTRLQEAGCIQQGACNGQFFFASQQVAAPWASEHPDFLVLSVEKAFDGLRDIARQQVALVARA
jgi:alkylmercury lyase